MDQIKLIEMFSLWSQPRQRLERKLEDVCVHSA
jgi:hypothetical protein